MSEEAFNAKYNGGQSPLGYTAAGAGDELAKLFDLKEKGAITEEEYTARKARVLA